MSKLLAGMWPAVFERPVREGGVGAGPDVDDDQYGSFVGNEDRRALQRLRSLSREHCAQRLHEGVGGSLRLTTFFEQIDTLQEAADERGQGILSALYDCAEQIAPQRE